MSAGYDNIAFLYDQLSKLVFGNSILHAHRFLVQSIPAASSILIVGGGTGFILNEISKVYPAGLKIVYVDSSAKMIALSQKRDRGRNEVAFIGKPIEEALMDTTFDVIMTPFFFDNFNAATGQAIFQKLNGHLVPQGLWLFADFQLRKGHKWWQVPMLKLMYLFFQLVCGIETKRLEDVTNLFDIHNYQEIGAATFYKNFITSVIYRKQ